QKRAMDVDMLPLTKEDEKIDVLLGEICTDIGMSRHVGKMDTQYTPLGTYYFQVGKDLTEVEYIIGTGGVIIYNNYPREILQKMMASEKNIMELRPKKAKFMLDKEYIFSAMGLLSMHEPLVALKIMKKYIINI
ncbi:MAG: glutamate mutase L, partial [Bacilli bacterium]|nr:glutamate mutase L [Bacilli bacterium]